MTEQPSPTPAVRLTVDGGGNLMPIGSTWKVAAIRSQYAPQGIVGEDVPEWTTIDFEPAALADSATPTAADATMSMRERLAGALHDASIPDADGYSLPQRMMSVHGGPRDSSYLDAADMILGTRYFDSGWLADSATGPLTEATLTRILGEIAPIVGGDLLDEGVPYRVGLASAILGRLPAATGPLPDVERLAQMMKHADWSMRSELGRNRSRTALYWRDLATLVLGLLVGEDSATGPLDVERAKVAELALQWYETSHAIDGRHDDHCPADRFSGPPPGRWVETGQPCTCGWGPFQEALARLASQSSGTTGRSFFESTGTAAEVEDAIREAKAAEIPDE